jgi:hypothetical protein
MPTPSLEEKLLTMTPAEHIIQAAKSQAIVDAYRGRWSNEATLVELGLVHSHLMFAQAKQGEETLTGIVGERAYQEWLKATKS